MRVISGSAKSLKLNTVPGDATRPTTDRIKETLFNMINAYVYDSRFLDLFAGSGGIGIEALSRGAKHCTFVDNNKKAVDCINKNLDCTHLIGHADVHKCDFEQFLLYNKKSSQKYDIVFIDPPYNRGLEMTALSMLADSEMIDTDTLIIVECSLDTDFSYIREFGYLMEKYKKYKTNAHVFFRMEKK